MAKDDSEREDRTPQEGSHPRPPAALNIIRRPLLTPLQRVGLPLLTLIPVLAIVGVLGVNRASVGADGRTLHLEVDYPIRARKGVKTDAVIRVENGGSTPLRGVSVTIDREYVDVFDEFTLTPAPSHITENAYHVDLGDLPAGESRLVSATLRPGWEYGQRRGTITAAADGMSQPVSVDFATFNFP